MGFASSNPKVFLHILNFAHLLRWTNITNLQTGLLIVSKQVIPPKFYLFNTVKCHFEILSRCCWKRHFSINVKERHQQTCLLPNALQQYILIIFSLQFFFLTLCWLYCCTWIPGHQKNWRIFLVLLVHDASQLFNFLCQHLHLLSFTHDCHFPYLFYKIY